MNIFTQLVCTVGRVVNNQVHMLGTGFFVSNDGKVVTSKHVVGNNDDNLVILLPSIDKLDEYQDTTDNTCTTANVKIIESDAFRDVVILQVKNIAYKGIIPQLGSFDDIMVGEEVIVLGFPHCVEGRRVLTLQRATIGAKVLVDSEGIKSKNAVINIQTRPGQSGSLIYSLRTNTIIGILMGTYAPESGVSIAGINPRELNQTTHGVSAEYIKQML
ncbi:V8-like Glu-specific endopeptidase [Turicibacter sanguinis]|nr:V8-like Glu-specific endopeptidase [Turicibacter sanguinis]